MSGTRSARRAGTSLAATVDRHLMRHWKRLRSRQFDDAMVMASRAADYSVLWLVLAGAGALVGGRRGKRAAANGLVALGFTSATVNGPLKLLFRRVRPVPGRTIYRKPRTPSFPSGHSASAFAFATAATRELPEAGPLLFPLAATVAYSRVYLGFHYPTDVLMGGAIGTAAGMAVRPVTRKLGLRDHEQQAEAVKPDVPSEAVLVASPHAGNSRKLGRARLAIERHGIRVAQQLDIERIDRLPDLLRSAGAPPRLVIAAGGDGTVGSVAACLVGSDDVLAILPLGTGNDFARSLGIPVSARRAAGLLDTGRIADVDVGRLTRPGEPVRYFTHAAAIGATVNFAKLATRASVRARLGRLTYLAGSVYALREVRPFNCTLYQGDSIEDLSLLQLAVINAPIFGGPLGLSMDGSDPGDGLLDVLVVEDIPPWKALLAGLFLLLRIQRKIAGIRALHVPRLAIDSRAQPGLTLDGELDGGYPGESAVAPPEEFDVAPVPLHVITPR
jgi:diacylglycerol kinase family enzyme/membrane-associated phospholipid phosphatase